MKKHLGTILGVLLTLAAAGGVFTWDANRRDASSFHRAQTLSAACYEGRRAETGAPVSQDFPECMAPYNAHEMGNAARMTSAAISGAGGGLVFALLFFGGRRFMRKREPEA